MKRTAMQLAPQLQEWKVLQRGIVAFCRQHDVSDAVSLSLQLVCEEWFINVVTHGYRVNDTQQMDGKNDASIDVMLWLSEPDEVTIQFQDTAPAFNPLTYEAPDVSLAVDERSIGGLGIHLIRTNMDHCTYERCGDMNRLTLRKKLNVTKE